MADDSDNERRNLRGRHSNKPYDEEFEVGDDESVPSLASPPPRLGRQRGPSRGDTPPEAKMSDNSDDDFDTGGQGDMPTGGAAPPPALGAIGAIGAIGQKEMYGNEDEDGDDTDSDDDDDDDDDDENGAVEGAYDPADYDHLAVTPEIKELFGYITRYTPQKLDLDYNFKPFIPDYIPSIGDVDAFLKIPRPDGKPDTLGLSVLDEPCAKQSDPTVLDLQLRAVSKQTNLKPTAVKSIEAAEKNPKAVGNWINSITDLHKHKPPPNVHYTKNMPDIDSLMQEWPAEFEELLKEVDLPSADLECDLAAYVDMICALLDIPIYKSKVQSLHVLFTLFSEFKNSQHFRTLATDNQLDNDLKDGMAGANPGDEDRLVL